MENTSLISMLPYIVAIVVSVVVLVLVWMRRSTRGALALWWLMFFGDLYALTYMLELISADAGTKLMWGNLRFIATAFGPLALLNFSFVFVRQQLHFRQVMWTLLFAWPILFILLVYSDPAHHLIYPFGSIVYISPYEILQYKMPRITWLMIFYSLGIGLVGESILISQIFFVRNKFRSQIYAILLGTAVPFGGVILSLMKMGVIFGYDISFFTVIIGNLIIVWGLFRLKLFDIVPVAREVLIENIHDGVLVLDAHQRVVDINPIALEYLNYDESNAIGINVSSILPAETNLFRKLNGNGTLIEIQLVTGGIKRDIEIKGVQLEDVSGELTGTLLVLYDVTERKYAQSRIKEANEQLNLLNTRLQSANTELEKLSRVKDEFISNISHELRSPLSNIRLNHDLLSLNPESANKYLDVLKRETARLTELIESLLIISRIDQKHIQLQKSSLDLNQLINEFVADRRSLAESCGLVILAHLDETMPKVAADRTMISQIISTILTNAINYTPSGGSITLSTLRRNQNDHLWAGFSIADTGIGITVDEQPKIFDRFYRGRSRTQCGISGTGLGLSIAKELVDIHGGEIQLESSGISGEGSCFTIWLPDTIE